ncbi:MAG: hypothetical protein AB8F74_11065 [Saprospiraceae bacterium]
MKNLQILLVFLLGLQICSCSSDDESMNTPDYSGIYTLRTIESDKALDPDVTGTFDQTELLDDLTCNSTILLNADSSFLWSYVTLNQIVNNIMGTTTYQNMECILFTGSTGSYQVSGAGVAFAFDDSISDISGVLAEDKITVVINEELAVEESGEVKLGTVSLTLVYEK